MLTQLVLLAHYINSVFAAKYDTKSTEGVTFTQWLSLVISRSIYIVLIGLIVMCVIVSAYRNRKQSKKLRDEIMKAREAVLPDSVLPNDNKWLTNLWKGPKVFPLPGTDFLLSNRESPLDLIDASDADSLQERLRDAEVAITALKEELDIANKARLELENSMESIERDKSYSDEELRKTKLNASLDLEEMKKEINALQRQLNQAQTEKEHLTKELEATQRENRIADSALRDQQNLTMRLEEAKTEINSLKEMMETMRSERDAAVKIASELVVKAKGVTKETVESRKLIREILEGTSKGSKFSSDAVGDGPDSNYGLGDANWRHEEEGETSRFDLGLL
ncbi:hypothetical protein O3M35_012160 [Rhynocoris fuscipes]|uniref:Uncharacterized protein n=1 Tax=Rhynocoris fuscipes TaxID=488301 RepID=A0AAW1CTZ3_9HEMI